MDRETRLKRLHFRASHRGTKEADILIGGFARAHAAGWDEAGLAWFEALLDEEDVEIMAWAIGRAEPPLRYAGPLMQALLRLDYVEVAK